MADQPAALASGAPARLGITVSRRVGPAVVRSRVKRQQTSVPGGKDVVVIARASAARTSPVDAARDLDAALRQLSRSKGTA
jgi:ribonuclease P protein component